MDAETICDLVAAVRMTCSSPDVCPDAGRHPATVSVHDGDAAVALLNAPDRLQELAGTATAGGALVLAEGASVEEGVAALKAYVKQQSARPSLIAVGTSALLVIGATPADALNVQNAVMGDRSALVPVPDWSGKRLAGCITVVTGGAQGFGRGIAESLAEQGACLWIADINDPPGVAFAEELNERFGPGVAGFCHVDVTDAASVTQCLRACVRAYGGVDMVISNAGVLRAGGLDELDERSFDLVTTVNYKAFYLCAKSAAAIMKRQHTFHPGHTMDIIQINSKSGLEGSNRNFAYAGSKFGSIGLAQSFAMELVEHGIKVNVVCPGNYFDGPLWSDPEKGLFVQYLRAGKVPGAETIDDVRQSYLSKVPMRRGCLPEDVARAVMYLHEQTYETGQALPVTGGQVMLR